jgi:signal transduction histidine kinase
MSLWSDITNTGLNFARTPAERRGILLTNIISTILVGLQILLFVLYYYWYGWSVITGAMLFFISLYIFPIYLNRKGYTVLSRGWLSILMPVIITSLSIYSKILYYERQEELDYFTFRFVILAGSVFPPMLFSIREKRYLITFLAFDFLTLIAYDPLHFIFGVPYQKESMTISHYYFTNVVVVITFSLTAGAIWFMKWISDTFEEKNQLLISDLNKSNDQLVEKNAEIEAQNQEIIAQSDNLNYNQQKLTDAYNIIEEQRSLLLRQNKNLSTELIKKNQDLTETNTELIKHNNELRQFSYTVSHNLRGPVASLLGLISLLREEQMTPHDREISIHLRTSAQRLDTIINDLGKIIDIRHDIFQIRQKVNLSREIDEIIQVLRKDIDQFDVKLETNLSTTDELYSVQPMVHSILYNLISNAIKYRSPERRPAIDISFRENPQHYILEITDNGLGIDLERHKEDLFKLYKRFHFHTEGKGLGLYLVKLQTEALGGSVHVDTEINRYTRFTVYLRKPGNITRQVLYKEEHAEIFFDAQINSTGIVWKGPVTSEQYRTVFQKCLDFVKVYNTPSYIADLSNQGSISREDQQWMFDKILPEASHNGLSRIAAIRPDAAEPLVKEYLIGINKTLSSLGVLQEYFLSMEEAVNWIQNENEKAAIRQMTNGKNH